VSKITRKSLHGHPRKLGEGTIEKMSLQTFPKNSVGADATFCGRVLQCVMMFSHVSHHHHQHHFIRSTKIRNIENY